MKWYAKKAGNEMQGLVIDEANGHTIAVAYDRDDMHLLAAAPSLLSALELFLAAYDIGPDGEGAMYDAWIAGRAAIETAKGGG